MSIYVDALINYGTGKGCFKNKPSCHLIADSREELDDFAELIGLKLHWFQYKPGSVPHYDLTASKRKLAIEKGAISITRMELVKKMGEIRDLVARGLYDVHL